MMPQARWALLSPEKQERGEEEQREQTEGGHYRQLSLCHIRNASCQHREKHRTPSLDYKV